tara:strand:- start:242 stop:874 length:633 start_codon:yes stop_codon:yes gene_type:complete
MANLIIKPTSGGSLILQDEGGTAAHTIDASGNHTLSGTTNNVGTVTAGVIGSAVTGGTGLTKQFDMVMPLHKAGAHDTEYGTFSVSADFKDSSVRCNGVVPKGFVSMDELYVFIIAGVTGNQTLTFGWETSTHGENYAGGDGQAVDLAVTGGTVALAVHTMYRYDLYNKQNDGTDLEDKVRANDAFAIEIGSGNGQIVHGVNVHAVFTIT